MPDDLVVDFVFVPNGAPWPADWVRRHPDYISLPAHFKGSPEQMRRMFGKYRPVPAQTFFQRTQADLLRPPESGTASGEFEPVVSSTAQLAPTPSMPPVTPLPPSPPVGIGGVVSAWTGGAMVDYPEMLPKIEPQSVQDTVIKALDLIEPGVEHQTNVRSFSKEFAQIVDPTLLNWDGWVASWSPHTKSDPGAKPPLEHRITSYPDYVVKFYPDDIHGPNMIVVTRPTSEPMHWIEAAMWNLGYFSNTILSHEFCVAAAGCGPYPSGAPSKK